MIDLSSVGGLPYRALLRREGFEEEVLIVGFTSGETTDFAVYIDGSGGFGSHSLNAFVLKTDGGSGDDS